MSFVSVLRQIGGFALGVEKIAAPIVSANVPGAAAEIAILDPLFQNLQVAIQTMEIHSPEGSGDLKSGAATANFQADLAFTQSVLAKVGKTLQYDTVRLQSGISNQVAALNDWAAVQASFTVVDLPKPAGTK